MKVIRWAAVGLIVLLVLAAIALFVANSKRDEIGRGLVNRLLADTEYAVTAISVSSLSARRIDLRRVHVTQAGGNEYRALGVSVEIDWSERWPTRVSIEELQIELAGGPAPAAPLQPAVRGLPGLVAALRPLVVDIASIRLQDQPPATNAVLAREPDLLETRFEYAGFGVAGSLRSVSANRHELALAIAPPGDGAASRVAITLDTGTLDITGSFDVPTSFIAAAQRDADALPFRLGELDAGINGQFRLVIDEPSPGAVVADIQIAIPANLPLLIAAGEQAVESTVRSAQGVGLRITYPDLAWSASADHIEADVRGNGIPELSLALDNLACTPGPACQGRASGRSGPVSVGSTTAAALALRSTFSFNRDDAGQVAGHASANIDVSDLSGVVVEGSGFALALEAELSGTPGPAGRDSLTAEVAVTVPANQSLTLRPGDRAVDATIRSAQGVALRLSYPDLDWRASARRIEANVGTAGMPTLSLSVADLDCVPALTCRGNGRVHSGPAAIGAAMLESLDVRSAFTLDLGETTRFAGRPGAVVNVTGLAHDAGRLAEFAATLKSDVEVTMGDSGWSTSGGQVEWRADGIEAGVPSLGRVSTSLHGTGTARRTSTGIDVDVDVAPAAGLPTGIAVRSHYPDSGGPLQLDIGTVRLDFGDRALSRWFAGWARPWDIVAGSLQLDAGIEIDFSGDDTVVVGRLTQQLRDIAGRYNDIGFVGLAADLRANLGPEGALSVEPFDVTLELLDVGIPINDVSGGLRFDAQTETVEVRNLDMSTLGGRITAEPFTYSVSDESARIVLDASDLQLSFIVGLLEFDDIETNGTLSGRIPVTVRGGNVMVDAGHLESSAQGGSIRVSPGSFDLGAMAGTASMATVTRSLENFQFETLSSEVSYTDAGDLKLQMRMRGINPDIDPMQPIILNLGVENNIPQLLRSLQAVRSIEDILERETRN